MKNIKHSFLIFAIITFYSITYSQSVDEIINNYITAIGGIDKINSIQTVKIYESTTRRGNEIPLTITIKRPDKIRTETTIQGQTQIIAYDGDKGWTLNPFRGSKDVEKVNPEQTRNLKESAEFVEDLVDYKIKGYTAELLGKDDFEGTDVYKVKLTNKDGDVTTYYIDSETYLILKRVIKRKMREVEISYETLYGDYKPEDGYISPHSLEVKQAGSRGDYQKITIGKEEFNIPVDDNIFTMPSNEKP